MVIHLGAIEIRRTQKNSTIAMMLLLILKAVRLLVAGYLTRTIRVTEQWDRVQSDQYLHAATSLQRPSALRMP